MRPDPAGSPRAPSEKEYFEAKLDALQELSDARRAALEILVTERFAALGKALDLKAEEYSVHFKALNNEAARIASVQSASVSRERFDGFEYEYRLQSKALSERMLSTDKFEGFEKEMRGVLLLMSDKFMEQNKIISDRILNIEAGAGARTKLFALIVAGVTLLSTLLIIASRVYAP